MKRLLSNSLVGAMLLAALPAMVRANDLAPQALLEAGHYKRLGALAEQRLKSNANDAAALYYLAYIKFQANDSDGALPLAEKCAAADPKNADCRYLIASIYGKKAQDASIFSQMGLARRFKKEAEATLAINPQHLDALLGLMEFHLRAPGIAGGDKKKADEYLNTMMRADAARGYLAQARKAAIEKQRQLMEGFYLKAVQANPKSYLALMTISSFYSFDDQKKYDLSEKYAKEALKVDADRIGAYSRLANLYAFQARWQELDEIIAAAEKAVPDNLVPYFTSARVLAGSGKDNARAERYLQKYLSVQPEPNGPSHALARWQLGLVYEKMGRKPEAIQQIQTALRLNPELEDAKKDLKRIRG